MANLPSLQSADSLGSIHRPLVTVILPTQLSHLMQLKAIEELKKKSERGKWLKVTQLKQMEGKGNVCKGPASLDGNPHLNEDYVMQRYIFSINLRDIGNGSFCVRAWSRYKMVRGMILLPQGLAVNK